MTIHEALQRIDPEVGKHLALEYFAEHPEFPGTGAFVGSHFDAFVREPTPVNEVTASDLLAVQMLAVKVPSRAVLGILETYASRISELLAVIDPKLRLEDVPEDEFDSVLGKESPAQALWDLLRRTDPGEARWGVGETIASKIMARKRPHLIPIDDRVVTRVIGRGRKNSWRMWWSELRADSYLTERAEEVKEHVNRTDLSTLRALDIVLWMSGRRQSTS